MGSKEVNLDLECINRNTVPLMREVIGPLSVLMRPHLGISSSLLAPDLRGHPQTVVSRNASNRDLVEAFGVRGRGWQGSDQFLLLNIYQCK